MRRPSVLFAFTVASLLIAAACGNAAGEPRTVADDVVLPITDTTTGAAASSASSAAPAAPTAVTTPAATATTAPPAPTTTTPLALTTLPGEPALPVPEAPPPADAVEPVVQVGSIELPAIGVAKPMYSGVSLAVLDHGPGHWPGTAEPGQVGNVVIAGHRMSHDRPFRDLDLLVPGDEMFLTDAAGARFLYHVVGTEIVTPDAMWIVDQTPASTATLFACHPKGSTRERIVVHLELVGPV